MSVFKLSPIASIFFLLLSIRNKLFSSAQTKYVEFSMMENDEIRHLLVHTREKYYKF